jgi:hypothetical protein
VRIKATWLWGAVLPVACIVSAIFHTGITTAHVTTYHRGGGYAQHQARLTALDKPGPPGELAEGAVKADTGTKGSACLTAASTNPDAQLSAKPCTTKLNALQQWKILRYKNVIIMGLLAQPGSCVSAVPNVVKRNRKVYHYAVTYNCGQQIQIPGILLGHIGSVYNTIVQAFAPGDLLSVTVKTGGNRPCLWLASNGNIPYAQVWLFPKFKVI